MQITNLAIMKNNPTSAEMTQLTEHLFINHNTEKNTILIEMKPADESHDTAYAFVDVEEPVEELMNIGFLQNLIGLVANLTDDDFTDMLPTKKIEAFKNCRDLSCTEFNDAIAARTNDPNRIYFPMLNGEVYDIEINQINWDDTVEQLQNLVNKMNSFKGLVHGIMNTEETSENFSKILENAEDIAKDAFASMTMEPDYSKLVNKDRTKLAIIQLFDLYSVYAQILTYANVYALRKDLMGQIDALSNQIANAGNIAGGEPEVIEPTPEDIIEPRPEEVLDTLADEAEGAVTE